MARSGSIKHGNVLALLNTLYTSGFAMASPGMPMLKGRTMHTLYALSFIVYSLNCICDWVHIYCTLKGYVTSFPLDTWLVVLLVSTVTAGTMLTGVLLVLCIENAFAHRLDIKPYRSGLTIIVEAFVEWIQAFNNFRVAFMVMILHDTPMTIINFFYVASCRCAGPQSIPWSLLISCGSTNVSVVWRVTMLYFAYRRMVCPHVTVETPGVHRFPTPHEHFLQNIATGEDERLHEYDECWPIRWARRCVYGKDPDEDLDDVSFSDVCKETPFIEKLARNVLSTTRCVLCSVLSVLGFVVFCASCCLPCIYHYTCRSHSFRHRHSCARNCVRYFSYIFHYSIFFFSLFGAVVLFVLNTLLLSSVHVLGSNLIPPEVNEVCVSISLNRTSATVSVTTSPLLSRDPPLGFDTTVCKPIWEDGGLGLGLKRKRAGPWQTRTIIDDKSMVAISTQVIVNSTDIDNHFLLLRFDRAVLNGVGLEEDSRNYFCRRGQKSGWKFVIDSSPLPWPYFRGCSRNWMFEETKLIECKETNPPKTATDRFFSIVKGAYYPGNDVKPAKNRRPENDV